MAQPACLVSGIAKGHAKFTSVIAGEGARGVALYDWSELSPRSSAAKTFAAAPRGHRGLDGTGKISKDMAMTAMPRIDARWSCVNQGLRGG